METLFPTVLSHVDLLYSKRRNETGKEERTRESIWTELLGDVTVCWLTQEKMDNVEAEAENRYPT